jgi:hypothetical protein
MDSPLVLHIIINVGRSDPNSRLQAVKARIHEGIGEINRLHNEM